MSEQPLLQALQRELALEKAARQELERQTVLKTRQLWHLREQQDKEVQQYQEQLSVLRTSLILAHKQQQHAIDPYENVQQAATDPKQTTAAAAAVSAMRHLQVVSTLQAEDASPTKADQRKVARQFMPDSQKKTNRSQDHQLSDQAAPGSMLPNSTMPATAAAAKSTLAQLSSNDQQTPTATEDHQQLMQTDTVDTAGQLLAAASKVQQLVEQLSSSEPSAAADLSVLQWQLTAIYGSLTCTDNNTSLLAASSGSDGTSTGAAPSLRSGVLQGVSCTGDDPLSAACSPAADGNSIKACKPAELVDAATGTSPLKEQATAVGAAGDASSAAVEVPAQPDHQQQQGQQQQQQQEQHKQEQTQDLQAAARVAAAAQLFSGAANTSSSGKLVAANLAWFYLEPGDAGPIVKGPYDAGIMLRWFLKGFLDNALRIAGVAQQQTHSVSSSSSSRVPPASLDDFQPLGQLLQQVEQGQGYTPASPGKEQLPSPAKRNSPARRPAQQQLPVSSSLGAYEPVSLTSAGAGGLDAGGIGGDGILAKGGSLLAETVGWWLNAAAAAQLPGSVSVVDIIEKVINSVAAPATVKASQ